MILYTNRRKCKLCPETKEQLFCPESSVHLQAEKTLLPEMIPIKSRGRRDGGSLRNPSSGWSKSEEQVVKCSVKIAYHLYQLCVAA